MRHALLRLWHTARFLRPVQIYGRVRLRLQAASPDLRPAPALRGAQAPWSGARRACSMTGPADFRFLSVERRIAAPSDWNRHSWEKLWLYNLHYFDDLAAHDAAERQSWHRGLLERWIAENPPGAGNGWEPYPTSLRIVNWIRWALSGNVLSSAMRHSLAVQTRWLGERMEVHLGGNHLLANAKALVFAGMFFEGDEAGGWTAAGIEHLERELPQQILPDGGHFERSPMYHLLVLEDLLDLIQVRGIYGMPAPEHWHRYSAAMLAWALAMRHPDGDIPFFNDAAFKIAPDAEELAAYAGRLAIAPPPRDPEAPVVHLAESGYAKLRGSGGTVFVDAAPIGPDHLPGHAHADTLSLEVSLGKRRVLVNSGTSLYGSGPERLRQRGTAAHNTIQIDGQNSSEVWAGFRVARRAYPRGVKVELHPPSIEAWHDGYERLSGRPRHHRRVRLDDRVLRIEDRVTGSGTHRVAGRFHLHPGVRVLQVDAAARRVVLGLEDANIPVADLSISGPVEMTVSPGAFHPEFGLSLPSSLVTFSCEGPLPVEVVTELRWP